MKIPMNRRQKTNDVQRSARVRRIHLARRAERDCLESQVRLVKMVDFLPDPAFAIDREGA